MGWWKREAVQNNSQGPVVEMSRHPAVSRTQTPWLLQGNRCKQEPLGLPAASREDFRDPILTSKSNSL